MAISMNKVIAPTLDRESPADETLWHTVDLEDVFVMQAVDEHKGLTMAELVAEELVPGDVVSIEAGDVVPADGRIIHAATLEIAESALTGESLPVSKGIDSVESPETPLGDRSDMVYMNTSVTRGSGDF